MNKLDKLLVGMLALNAVVVTTLVGKERKPIKAEEAAFVVGIDALLIGALVRRGR